MKPVSLKRNSKKHLAQYMNSPGQEYSRVEGP
jgi:hypothetical protein